jgi:hypothetical protein
MATASWPECYSDAAAPRRLFRCCVYSAKWRLSCYWCGDPDLNRQKQLAMDLA